MNPFDLSGSTFKRGHYYIPILVADYYHKEWSQDQLAYVVLENGSINIDSTGYCDYHIGFTPNTLDFTWVEISKNQFLCLARLWRCEKSFVTLGERYAKQYVKGW